MQKIVITGGTGLIGKALTKLLLSKGHQVNILTRSLGSSNDTRIKYFHWSPADNTIDEAVFENASAIIHLAGENVADGRWTAKRKLQILQSRTQSSSLIVKALKENDHQVRTVISASAIGWYGPDDQRSRSTGFSEEHQHYNDYLGNTCKEWEASIDPVSDLGIRSVKLRTGIVLTKEGGALKEFMRPLKAGIATIMGSGEQVVSWIHIEDLCRMYLYALENADINGVFNAVAPLPVTNKELILTLAKQQRGKNFIPVHVPAFILKLVLGEMSIEVLKSATVSSDKIKNAGFHFLYPGIRSAIEAIIKD